MTALATTPRLVPALAPDPALPARDLMLDPVAVAARLPGLLDPDASRPRVDSCTLLRVKYRVGESLRVVYRLTAGGQERLVTARLFPGDRSRAAYEQARLLPAAPGTVRQVAHDPDAGAVWWTFPRDRKLGDLGWLTRPDPGLARQVLPDWRRTDVVQYVPERSLTGRALDLHGATLAYGKAYGAPAVPPSETARRHRHLSQVLRRTADPVSVPTCLAWSDDRGLLLMEPMAGQRWNLVPDDELAGALRSLGIAIARLHGSPPLEGLTAFGRLRPDRVGNAAAIVGRARPDVARHAEHVAGRLRAAVPDREAHVVLHGDCHPGNALLAGDRVALLDLDQMGHGPAAADLGSLVARLRYAAVVGELDSSGAVELESSFLRGYAERRPLPDARSLAWHTAAALVAERALRVVNRVNRPGLACLEELLAAADGALDRGVAR